MKVSAIVYLLVILACLIAWGMIAAAIMGYMTQCDTESFSTYLETGCYPHD